VRSNILVPLLKTTVLLDVVQVVPSDDNCILHLSGDNLSIQNSSSDGNVSGEGTFLVDVVSLNSGVRSLDSKTNVLDEAHGLCFRRAHSTLARNEDSILLLVSLLVLCKTNSVIRYSIQKGANNDCRR
jgi:hypothetical protein